MPVGGSEGCPGGREDIAWQLKDQDMGGSRGKDLGNPRGVVLEDRPVSPGK